MEYGIFGIVILILDIIAIISVWSSAASTLSKLLWTALILILPVIGLIAWFFLGPKRGRI
ncbi:phospholipase D-like protein [Blastomonas natatoria]|uniref:Phospholipase D-like protein n=1 Tax=Blastomonas natatoria TaxID=34015 RepID=A0A2V3V3K3_9SPHN|nr:PLDc N-terminal domain-containing protein [Blastomonas natatoria]PXW76343.1 phospholipase D-like protein [Blastomonas natatoria]